MRLGNLCKRACTISLGFHYLCTEFSSIFRAGIRYKGKKICELPIIGRKYGWTGLAALFLFLQALLWGGCGRMRLSERSPLAANAEPVPEAVAADSAAFSHEERYEGPIEAVDSLLRGDVVVTADSVAADSIPSDHLEILPDTAFVPLDSLLLPADSTMFADSLADPGMRLDSLGRRDYGPQFLDDILTETHRDSMVFNVRTNKVYTYGQAEVVYQQQTFKNVDYMEVDLTTKDVIARGVPDSTGTLSRPTLVDNGHEYDLNNIDYNLNTHKAKIRGVWTTEGDDGILRAAAIKKQPDNSLNIIRGTYTTCDEDNPHYQIRLLRAKSILGQKTIFQWAILEIEQVPIPFPAVPFGFFPMNDKRSSGFIMPSFGEENARGFYLRDIGYQYAPNDYMSMRLLSSFYTLGSWEARLENSYRVRYKFSGNVNLNYASNKFGDRGSADYNDSKTYRINWRHQQDPKSGINFSASVDFSSSQNNRYNPGTINDFANNQANSSISYQKSWAGTPFALSVAATHSQNNRDSTYTFNLPNLSFNVNTFYPFKFKNRRPGPARWYEKISTRYGATFQNSVASVKEYNLFKPVMFEQMETSMKHNVQANASFALFDNININPSFSYSEEWNTRRVERRWDPELGRQVLDSVRGFNRGYQYSGSVNATTTVYGMFDFSRNPYSKIQAIRHTITPTFGFSFRPNFGKPFYGLYEWVQGNAAGDYQHYSPYRGAGSNTAQAAITFSLSQTLEAKVLSDRDSTGMSKIKIIDDFSISGISYNFLLDSMRLSTFIPVRFRSTLIKGFNIDLSTNVGITAVDKTGRPIDHYFWERGSASAGAGKAAIRIENLRTSFNWSHSWGGGSSGGETGMAQANTDVTNPAIPGMYDAVNPYDDPNMDGTETEAQRQEAIAAYRSLLSSQYYDFSMPLTVGFNASISYTNNGITKKITPTLSFNANVNLTPKWGITMTSGYDFNRKQLIPTTSFTLARDLHCMQMNFNWIPIGPMKSYNFHISVKSNILRDLKYEKSGNRFDELFYDR